MKKLRMDQLQLELEGWRADNFGPGSESFERASKMLKDPNNVMMVLQGMGIVEELGELFHAILKRFQGIRGMDDPLTFSTAVMDAVGDMLIFCMGLCDTFNLNLSDCLEKTAEQVLERDWNADKEDGVSERKVNPLKLDKDSKLEKMHEDLTGELLKVDQINRIFNDKSFSLEQLMVFLCTSSAIQLMVGKRNDDYNEGGVEITDYWDNLSDSFQMVKVKFLRTKSLTAKTESHSSTKTLLKLADSCIDLINYASFHVANAMRQSGQEDLFSAIVNKYQCHEVFLRMAKKGEKDGDDD